MSIPKKDLHIETTKGTGKGGQRKNKVETAVRVTHLPTGITAYADTRSQNQSRKKAIKDLERKLKELGDTKAADAKKAERDRKVREAGAHRRTYHQCRQEVTDHRTGMKRKFDDVVKRGRIQDFLDGELADL